jgi:signal transduction histidine kinase
MASTRGINRIMRSRIAYPWISSIAAMVLVVWQFSLANIELFGGDILPAQLQRQEAILTAGAVLILLILFDITRFVKALSGYRNRLKKYESQISELFDSKRELGTRARTYSDHAEKLKLFISDRLLEYIEYDEKFLHFKNIASEVRHNGVISYDKVQTALKLAQGQSGDHQNQQYQEAADSLLYLWDLLDLSTTDNISLHVANQIYDCEEYYFQSLLSQSDLEQSPFTPTFSVSTALLRALLPIADSPDELRAWKIKDCPTTHLDSRFNIQLIEDSEILGNENHIVLLIENLLNNALFYAQQKSYKNRYSRVTIQLSQVDEQLELKIYNCGPKIKDEDKDRIYQLGYSSRRVRDYHGKGLGLYFVNEIAKGFEGSISYENVENNEDNLTLRIALDDGEIHSQMISIVQINGKPRCKQSRPDDPLTRKLEWSYSSPIASIEVSSQLAQEPQVISDLAAMTTLSHVDSIEPLSPRWVLEISNKKKSAKLVFLPIDARGVQFIARFPTAQSRLENLESDIDG